MKRSKEKKRVIFCTCGMVLCLILAYGCFIYGYIIKCDAYQDYITISSSTSMENRLGIYQRAIRLCPDRPEAYILLLDAYGEDGVFDASESEAFLGIYNANHTMLPENEDSAAIYAKAGMIYINGYENTATVSLRMAMPFFEAALPLMAEDHPDYNATACYVRIGQYYRDYIWTAASKEVTPEKMTVLLTDIESTVIGLSASDSADRSYNYLGFANAVCNLLYDQRNVLAATVEKQEVLGIMDLVYSGMPDVQTLQSSRTKEMALLLETNRDMYYDMISRAFDRNGGG